MLLFGGSGCFGARQPVLLTGSEPRSWGIAHKALHKAQTDKNELMLEAGTKITHTFSLS